MEYERIHKVQTGIISPSKLRMKLIGPHHQKKNAGSNSNSSRTSPSKLEDSEFVKNGLLAAQSGDFDQEVSTSTLSENSTAAADQGDSGSSLPNEVMARETSAADYRKTQRLSKADFPNFNPVNSVKTHEDDNLDYDSTSSFEFHKGERLHHHPARSFSRPMPSKWNDAEKWIMNRQNVPPNYSKKIHLQHQHQHQHRSLANNMVRVAPESANYDNKSLVKRVDFCQPASQLGAHPISAQGNGTNASIDLNPDCRDLMEVENEISSTKNATENTTGVPGVRSVSMRDMGTEMTPIPSQEPSRTATPLGSTPLRSPTSSIPSTPRWGEPAPTPTVLSIDGECRSSTGNGKKDMSEQELKLKTRREIVALGVKLGKMNIAAWASKDDKSPSLTETSNLNELEQIEFAKRAAAWEEAEKTKHNARLKLHFTFSIITSIVDSFPRHK
ncbi:OLC1v1024316C1 [Oldenlandia corymbosa var. corymbosa]|uniref:OLC1v1024316C1 n=1 Tax=Oldenlandia corymbosa var. corymbosa TaxID=529605 RepID=A0AAV1C227_OLDCO|nr:OLC1v1024316C1 [Oldenlandia corymbosa var. corymbosa]